MIKKIAWDAFKNTGDINTFLEFKQLEIIEKELQNTKQVETNHEYKENKDENKTQL